MNSIGMSRLRDLRERLNRIFADKEVFFRSGGEVRFLRISRTVQISAAAILAAILLVWLAATAAMLYGQASVAQDRAAMDAKAKAIAAEARKVNFFKRAADDIAADLDRRQNALDDIVKSQFGPSSADAASVVGKADEPESTPASSKKLSDAASTASASPSSAVSRLKGIAHRQTLFAQRLAVLIDQRAAKAEAAIRSFGLNPKQIASGARAAQGGPFIPWSQADIAEDDALSALAKSFARLNALEQGLAAIPSGRPTASPMQTSSYGYRRDPFNGHAAFHAGIDFPGSYGQPILAAAPGRVVYVGPRQGYGNIVEVDHGHGILTRYAHLSRFGVRTGALVQRGDAIARMGSTGRSTGTHLHFEVRVNGNPINPTRFLEVRQDVLQVQQIAKQRIARVRSADESRNDG